MKCLAVDLGKRNIGIALSDKKGIIAEPYKIIIRKNDKQIIKKILNLCNEKKVEKIIIGLPLTAEKQRQEKYKLFAQRLKHKTDIPIDLWDESFSTKRAQNMVAFLDNAGKKKKTNSHRDDVAAAFILQEYLDHEKKS